MYGTTAGHQRLGCAITACEQRGLWEAALRVLRGLGHLLLQPHTISFNAAICACERGAVGISSVMLGELDHVRTFAARLIA